MALTLRDRIRRFEDGRSTPPSCWGLHTDGERLYSYNYEIGRHAVSVDGTTIRFVICFRDRCDSTVTTKRHWQMSRSGYPCELSPACYERVAGRNVLVNSEPQPHFSPGTNFAHRPDDEMWALWLKKLELERGPAARTYAARRLAWFRKKMNIKRLIDAL